MRTFDCSTGLDHQFSARDYSRVRAPCRLDGNVRRWCRSNATHLPAAGALLGGHGSAPLPRLRIAGRRLFGRSGLCGVVGANNRVRRGFIGRAGHAVRWALLALGTPVPSGTRCLGEFPAGVLAPTADRPRLWRRDLLRSPPAGRRQRSSGSPECRVTSRGTRPCTNMSWRIAFQISMSLRTSWAPQGDRSDGAVAPSSVCLKLHACALPFSSGFSPGMRRRFQPGLTDSYLGGYREFCLDRFSALFVVQGDGTGLAAR